jgi:hypothetical protein
MLKLQKDLAVRAAIGRADSLADSRSPIAIPISRVRHKGHDMKQTLSNIDWDARASETLENAKNCRPDRGD